MTELEFVKCMKVLTSIYESDMDQERTIIWFKKLGKYDINTFYSVIKNLKNKKMPNAIELEELCDKEIANTYLKVLNYMKQSGYFKFGYKELSSEQEHRNYEKALIWVGDNTIPYWLLKDIEEFKAKLLIRQKFTNKTIRLDNLNGENKAIIILNESEENQKT